MENSKIRESLFHYQTRYPYKEFAGLRNSCCKISLMALVQSQTVKTVLLSFGVTKLCDSRTLERRFDRNFCIKNPPPWKKIRSKLLELHDFVTTASISSRWSVPRFLFLLTRREQNIPVNFVSLGQVSITITRSGEREVGEKLSEVGRC